MKTIKIRNIEKGVLLIICLILLVVLSGIGITVTSIAATNNKAIKYSNAKLEAQQKADGIANFVFARLSDMNQDHSTDITTCSMAKTCLIWDSTPTTWGGSMINSSITDDKSDPLMKTCWRTYAQDYPQANELHAITDYSERTGSSVTDPVAAYAIIHVATDTSNPPNGIRILKIIAYATDATGRAAAIKELYYSWQYTFGV